MNHFLKSINNEENTSYIAMDIVMWIKIATPLETQIAISLENGDLLSDIKETSYKSSDAICDLLRDVFENQRHI